MAVLKSIIHEVSRELSDFGTLARGNDRLNSHRRGTRRSRNFIAFTPDEVSMVVFSMKQAEWGRGPMRLCVMRSENNHTETKLGPKARDERSAWTGDK